MNDHTDVAHHVHMFCHEIGKDPLLVQGAGGNVSWKADDILWIKASGKWLADALSENIFVPVDRVQLNHDIAVHNYDTTPNVLHQYSLRPSIETILHALLPHPIVVHLHAVEALAHLVDTDAHHTLLKKIPNDINWAIVPYHKPGAQLALAIHQAIQKNSTADVIFLQNHGIVIGGSDITSIEKLMYRLLEALKSNQLTANVSHNPVSMIPELEKYGYYPTTHAPFHQLILNPLLTPRLHNSWAVYPDHVVFLGPEAITLHPTTIINFHNLLTTNPPAFVFVHTHGTFVHHHATRAHHDQLQCYLDVLQRLPLDRTTITLNIQQISEILNWDAEKYRQQIKK
jgi:rhamnose utilization protein RhaD (predicted bifunctional aldolase and dehydrogenase)